MSNKILIIEDEKEIRENLVRILNLSNYNTISADNGLEGLLLARKHVPALIISDIMMPEIDGYALLSELQKDPETTSIPFMFLSAKSNRYSIREGMNLGADDFITKPFDIDELLNAVETRLEKKKKRESHLIQTIENLQTNLKRALPHEIRTPLNTILGFSDFLMNNISNIHKPEIMEMLYNINDSGKRLLRIFENYLLLSNLEIISKTTSEKNDLRKSIIQLADSYIYDLVYQKVIDADRVEDLQLDLEESSIRMSEVHFRKLLSEIMDNAIKFSIKNTPIEIYSNIKNKSYFISFTDYGRGLTSEQIKSIDAHIQFERNIYEQQGTGHGLAIVKKILEIYNGNFTIISEVNNFTTVKICIPIP
jgi:DNA-binding response OmpR family regulator/anti-sigma regulatory factor (Ser/Thr protein kinase)